MGRALTSAADFKGDAARILCRSANEPLEFGQNGRTIRYVLSTPAVARDFHTIASGAWQTDNFERNPVFLWAHDDTQLPIGKITDLGEVGSRLKGTVEYPERDLNPFADTVYQLVRAGYLNSVSVSWMPLEWSFTADKKRPGGIDFRKVDLLEVSQVPVPAHPDALAEARAAGIDTTPIYAWAEKLLDGGGRIVVPRNELDELRRAAKMPSATNRASNTEAEWKVGASQDLPIEDSDDWNAAVAEKAGIGDEEGGHGVTKFNLQMLAGRKVRGLGHVSWLAYLVDDLGFLKECIDWEASIEGDGSDVPAQLAAALMQLGQILIDMTNEEVAELLGCDGDDDLADGLDEDASDAQRALHALAKLGRRADLAGKLDKGDLESITRALAERFGRAGRVLSAENERTLRDAHDHMTQATDMVRSVFDQVDPVPEQDEDQDQGARAVRARRLRAIQLRGAAGA